jgi:chromosomal replication initiation ATPase DnaA
MTLSKLYEGRRWPVVLGNEDFIERIRFKGARPTKEHVREDRRFVRPSVEKVLNVVSQELDVPLRRLVEGQRGESNIERKVALWALRELGDYTHNQIATLVGGISAKTIGWACQEIQREVLKNRRLKMSLKIIEQRIGQPET